MKKETTHGENRPGKRPAGAIIKKGLRGLTAMLLLAAMVLGYPAGMVSAATGGPGAPAPREEAEPPAGSLPPEDATEGGPEANPPPEESAPPVATAAAEMGTLDDGDEGFPCVPAYCNDADCPCGDGTSPCVCEDTCACRTVTLNDTCISPGACGGAGGCLCGTDAALCICPATCACQMPAFTVQVETTFKDGNNLVSAATLAAGDYKAINVNYRFNSSEASFSDIYIRTYLPAPLEAGDIDLQGQVSLVSAQVNPETGATEVLVKCSARGAGNGTYSFDVRFPPGTTPNALERSIHSEVTGKLTTQVDGEDKTWDVLPQHNATHDKTTSDPLKIECVATAKAEAEWTLTLSNADVDYADPSGADSTYGLKAVLKRTPSTPTGSYDLIANPGSFLSITLFDELDSGSQDAIAAGLAFLRVVDKKGNPIPHTVAGNQLKILLEDLPLDPGFSGNPRASAATEAELLIVYSVPKSYLDSLVTGIVDGFTLYDGKHTGVFDHFFVVDEAPQDVRHAPGETDVGMVTYTPGKSGNGSISKSAVRFIEGTEFFAKPEDAAPHTPITYSIYYNNSSNTPVENLVITDVLPQLLQRTGDAITGDAKVYFGSVELVGLYVAGADNPDDPATAPTISLDCVYGGSPVSGGALALNSPATVDNTAQTATELQIKFDGVLRHGFSARFEVTLYGDPAPSDADKQEVAFVRNGVNFEARSTEDGSVVLKRDTPYTHTTHVYPYQSTQQHDPSWGLVGSVSAKPPSYADEINVSRNREVYIRLEAAAANSERDHLYSPVFFVEIPPELSLDDGNPSPVTYGGSAGDISLDYTLITNPMGAGAMLRIENPDEKQLLDPSAKATVTVRCKTHAEAAYGSQFTARVLFGETDPLIDLATPQKTTPPPPGPDTDKFIDTGIAALFPEDWDAARLPQILLVDTVTININGSGHLEGELWVLTEKDRATGTWRRHPEVAETMPGGLLDYKFVVRNSGHQAAEKLALYCVFSNVGDSYLTDNTERKSAWEPYLTGPIAFPNEPKMPDVSSAIQAIEYSEFGNHKLNSSGVPSGADDWTTTPYDYPSVKAIRIIFKEGYQLTGSQQLELVVPMFAPTDHDFASPLGDSAVCSLASSFVFSGEPNAGQALEPLKVAVRLVENKKGEISGMVWGELDGQKNGVCDEAAGATRAEFPKGGVTMVLVKDGAPQYTAITDEWGQYKFTNLEPGSYVVYAALPAGYAIGGAGSQNQFAATADSVTLPGGATYSSCIKTAAYTVVATAPEVTAGRVYTDVDGGIYATPGTIGGTVWRNIEADGERDTATTGKDVPLGSVPVTLYRVLSGGRYEEAATTTSASDGTYGFAVEPGRYYVQFGKPPKAANYSYVPQATVNATTLLADPIKTQAGQTSGNAGGDNHANLSSAAPEADTSNGVAAGQGHTIWLEPGARRYGVDCGFAPATGSITGTLWEDKAGNGAKDAGDANLAGLKVLLYKTAGYGANLSTPLATTETTAAGAYTFGDLGPGTYKVAYVCGNPGGTATRAQEYVSFYKGDETLYPTHAVPEAARGAEGAEWAYTGIEVDPAEDLAHTGRDYGLVRKIQIKGRVYEDKYTDGKYTTGQTINDVNKTGVTALVTRYDDASTNASRGTVTLALAEASADTAATGYATAWLWPGHYTVTFADNSLLADWTSGSYINTIAALRGSNKYDATAGAWGTWTLDGLPSGSTTTEVDLAYTRPRTLAGLVWHDVDGDGATTGDAALAASLSLTAYPARTLTLAKTGDAAFTPLTSNTSATGAYGFGGLLPGTYTVTLPLDDGGAPTPDYIITNEGADGKTPSKLGVYTLTIPVADAGASADAAGVDFGLAKPVGIEGTIWRDDATGYTTDGIYQSGEALLGFTNVAEVYRKTGASTYSAVLQKATTTAGTGTYSLSGLLPGQYKVLLKPGADYYSTATVTSCGTASFTYAEATGTGTWADITVYSGQALTGYDLPLGKYATITGKLWHDVNGDGVMDAGEEALTSASSPETVKLYKNSVSGSPEATALVADTTGVYTFKVKPGLYVVTLERSGRRVTNLPATGFSGIGEGADPTWTIDNPTTEGAKFEEKHFLLSLYAKILGEVWVDADANAEKDTGEAYKPGVQVTLMCTATAYEAWWKAYTGDTSTTNWAEMKLTRPVPDSGANEGKYAFDELWPGTYTVTLSPQNAADAADFAKYVRTNLSGSAKVTQKAANDPWTWQVVVDSNADNTASYGMVKSSSLAGYFYNDADASGDKQSGEDYIGTATLTRTVAANSNEMPCTRTATPESAFSFDGLLPGTYSLTLAPGTEKAAWLRTHHAATLTHNGSGGNGATIAPVANNIFAYTVAITDGAGTGIAASGAVAGYAAPGTIGGNVFVDADQNELFESESLVTAAAAVIKKMEGSGYATGFAPGTGSVNTAGNFSFVGLLPGKYEITFTGLAPQAGVPNWLTTTSSKSLFTGTEAAQRQATFTKATRTWVVELKTNGQLVTVDTGLIKAGALSGMVWKDLNADGDKDTTPAEPFFTGSALTVTVFSGYDADITSDTPVATGATASATGLYKIEDLYPGQYTLALTPPDATWHTTNTGTGAIPNKPWTLKAQVAAATETEDNDYGLVQLAKISGMAWVDKDTAGANGIFNGPPDEAINGATVTLAGTAGDGTAVSATATTAAGGAYAFTGLVPGSYTLTFSSSAHSGMVLVNSVASHASGNNTATLTRETREWAVTITSGFQQENCDYALAEASVLVLDVWHDLNANGTQNSPEDAPLKDYRIHIFYDEDGDTSFSKRLTPAAGLATAADGQCSLAVTASGDYRADIELQQTGGNPDEWVTTAATNSVYRSFASMNQIQYGEYGVSRYLKLTGRVWTDPQYDTVYTAGSDTPEANHKVEVRLASTTDLVATLYTGADGSFTTQNTHKLKAGEVYTVTAEAKAGDYVVINRADAFAHATRVWQVPAQGSGATVSALDCVFAQWYSVAGELWLDMQANGKWLTGEGDAAFQNIRLTLTRTQPLYPGGPDVTLDATTQSDGSYRFTGVVPGNYALEVNTDDAKAHFWAGGDPTQPNYPGCTAQSLCLVFTGCKECGAKSCPTPGHAESDINERTGAWLLAVEDTPLTHVRSGVHLGSEISGTLTNQKNGKPMPGQTVRLYRWNEATTAYDEDPLESCTTNENGAYLFQFLKPGTYQVRLAIPRGYDMSSDSEGHQEGSEIVVDELTIAAMGGAIESTLLVKPRPKNNGGGSGGANGTGGAGSPGALGAFTGPQTGDTTSFLPALLLAAASLATVVAGVLRALPLCRRRPARHFKK